MPILPNLLAAAGRWQGTNRLHDPNTNQTEDTPSTLVVTPMLAGRFVLLEYTWQWQGQPQSGAMIVGHEPDTHLDTAYWVDTWHNGDRGMLCQGPGGDTNAATVRGTFPAPPGPDWGWDIVLTPKARESFEIVMHVYTPDGEQGPAVEAWYTAA